MQCPNHERPSRLSLKLAQDFIHTFHENILKMDYHRTIHCSVAIASGELEGFFTRGFPIEYHLHGEPLIKADQINEISKQARKNGLLEGSTIVIQDRVYNSLSSEERPSFTAIEWTSRLTLQSDSNHSQKLYYQRVRYQDELLDERNSA
ncbi:hypothetical protein [Oligoflexus sp.]|uniref:hypothetical protein n=1 Tax=Oligoflexus sp. TaxID=1971216 RepID=UPI002D76E279|nr:hypothetical protein [Oligoflexus sp.]